MRQLLKDPRIQISFTLLLIFVSAVFYYHRPDYLKLLATAVGSAILFDFIFLKIRKVDLFIPVAALTSGLIISLLISPTLPFYESAVAAMSAMFFKNFIRFSRGHVFNPAGIGVFTAALLFNHNVSWWAVSFQQTVLFYLILLSPALISIVRLRRYKIIIPFLIVYSLTQIVNHQSSITNLTIDPTVLFFSIVMLPEPQTTPNKQHIQILFGTFVAFAGVIFSKFLSVDPLILSLMAGNLVFYRLK